MDTFLHFIWPRSFFWYITSLIFSFSFWMNEFSLWSMSCKVWTPSRNGSKATSGKNPWFYVSVNTTQSFSLYIEKTVIWTVVALGLEWKGLLIIEAVLLRPPFYKHFSNSFLYLPMAFYTWLFKFMTTNNIDHRAQIGSPEVEIAEEIITQFLSLFFVPDIWIQQKRPNERLRHKK